ncbi:MAG: hypothetical protein H7326_11835 [Bdellovibrionaceae bacterium]|nr:hypothetical protein [Pseudobdellovibrionaceae bacterium]
MSGIQCKIDIPKVSGLDDGVLTVGREFYLNCEGEWPRTLVQEKLHFEAPPEQKYVLRLMKFEFRTPTQADLTVTSYIAGDVKIPNLILTDDTQKLELGPVDFQVKSVIKQGEKVEAFGPIGPATIGIPFLYWILLLATIGIVIFAIVLRVWRASQRRAMLERLKQHDSALTPIQEFHGSMRKLQRANPVFYGKDATSEELRAGIEELARMFKVYISRRLSVPAFEWSERLILNDIRRYHAEIHAENSRKIHDLFTEFKKAQGSTEKLNGKDVTQLSESLRKNIEAIERQLNAEPTGKRGSR